MRDATHRHSEFRNRANFGSLDGLRFLCIALVLWHHGPIWGAIPAPPQILSRGFVGVDFFFVLSGFLITTLLLREEARDGRFSLRAFYMRRILRIVPVYFLAISLIGIWWIAVRGQDQWVPLLPYYYLFLANFLNSDIPLLAPMWSLSVEEQYYLVWPLVLAVVVTNLRARAVLLLAAITYCVLSADGIIPVLEPVAPTEHARFVLPVTSYSAILIGSLIAVVLHTPGGFAILWRLFGHRWTPAVALALLGVALHVLPPVLMGWPNFVVHGLMAATVAGLVLREDHVLAGPMQVGFVARLGKISYGLYIWHLVGLHNGGIAGAATGLEGWVRLWVVMAVYLGAAIAIAELSYRYFESYFLKLKDAAWSRRVARRT